MSLITDFVFSSQFTAKRHSITVVGDAMIDQYFDVEATRISPEFPIPVMRSPSLASSHEKPGGAANVAYQMMPWKIDSKLIAWMDGAALDCITRHVKNVTFVDWQEPIPRKMRIYDGKHPTFRWDIEKPVDPKTLVKIQDDLLKCLTKQQGYGILILSDYNKGTFDTSTSIGYTAKSSWIKKQYTTIVDPKSGPIDGWKGCTVFKPNKKEAEELSGHRNWQAQCDFFLKQLQCEHVVITQGHEGVVGMSSDGSAFEYRPDFHIDPKSVIGAGDCFVAFLAMALSHDYTIDQASEIAYKAGACYVQHDRNEPVTPYELLAFEDPIAAKFLTPPLPSERKFKLGLTNGCFDLLHVGHVESLRFAKKHCDKLVVAVNSDNSVKRLKSPNPTDPPRPIISIADRTKMLASLDCVDYVLSFESDTPYHVIELLKPDVLVKGEDYRNKEVVGAEFVKEVVFAPLVEGVSTSQIEYQIQCWG